MEKNNLTVPEKRQRKMSVYNADDLVVPHTDLQATAMACDCAGNFIVLGGRKALAIINLDRPHEIVKTFPRVSKWEITTAQWNPHPTHSHLFLTASNQVAELWNWNAADSTGKQIGSLKSHTRTICDLDWSCLQANITATCSLDMFTFIWDIRDIRKPSVTLQSVVGASQVKWNKLTENVLATSHEGDLRIWDLRKSNTPYRYITAHTQKIYGLDWCPTNDSQVATCSYDGTVKFWDTEKPKQETDKIQQANFSFWRAKYTPFGSGMVTVFLSTQIMSRGEGNLYLWRLDGQPQPKQPVHTFVGHTNVVLDFNWRRLEKDYQMISWSRDQTLRFWRADFNIRQLCGSDIGSQLLDSGDRVNSSSDKPHQPNKLPVSHTDPSFAQHPRTLQQEFTLLNSTIPKIIIEEMDVGTRRLQVRATNGHNKVCLLMVFPNVYPDKVPPHFYLLDDTTVDPVAKAGLAEDLMKTANQHVQFGRCCIEPCLRKLVTSLESITVEQNSPDVDIQPGQDFLSYSTEKLRDENVPFPRISGARFCGPGYLVCFTRRMFLDVQPSQNVVFPDLIRQKQPSECDVTPRAMSALSEINQLIRISTGANSMRSFAGLARSLPNETNVPSVSQYYQMKDQKPKSKVKARRSEPPTKSNMKSGKKNLVGPVVVYDLSCLLPVQKLLGENYVFDDDVVAMCLKNAQVASTVNRKDLVQVWSMAALEVKESLASDLDPDKDIPWPVHPFGRNLIKSWFDNYSLLKDVQTLAMLCCVFGRKSCIQCSPSVHQPSPSVASMPSPPSASSNRQCYPDFSSASHNTETNILNSFDEANNNYYSTSVNKRPRSNSWSDMMYEQGSTPPEEINLVEQEVVNDLSKHMKNLKLLDPSSERQYDLFLKSYANILFQWGCLSKRAELLDHLFNPVSSLRLVTKSKEEKLYDDSKIVKCVLCRMRVTGLSISCMDCGHGGHLPHMSDWFATHNECASGCGCNCLFENPPTVSLD